MAMGGCAETLILVFKKLWFFGLLLYGLMLSRDAIVQYRDAKTSFDTFQQPISMEDLPVLTICYGRTVYHV